MHKYVFQEVIVSNSRCLALSNKVNMSELLKLREWCVNMVYDVLYRFYSHCEGYEPTLMLIRTTDGEVPKLVSRSLSLSLCLFLAHNKYFHICIYIYSFSTN